MANQNAFAESEAIRFDDTTTVQFARKAFRRRRLAECAGACGRNSVALHELLREYFGGFKLSGAFVRSPDTKTFGLKKVHNTVRERVVWPNHGQVDFLIDN